MKYTTDHRLTSRELKKFLSEKYQVKTSKIETWTIGKNYIYGEFVKGKEKYKFSYDKDDNIVNVYSKTYAVRYLRETPFGYGGGWTTMPVQADSEAEALEIAEASCRKEWGNLSPCSRFSVVDWN